MMKRSIYQELKEIGRSLMAAEKAKRYKISEFPRIFKLLAGFLDRTPETSFSEETFTARSAYQAPLLLSDKGKSKLRSTLKSYPHVYEAGLVGHNLNLLNLVGQLLTSVEMRLETLEIKDPDEYKKHEGAIKEYRRLWGSKTRMSARSLYNRFKNKSISEAKDQLGRLLEESAQKLKGLADITDF